MERDHVKNSKTRFETDCRNPSETERKSSDFAPYGMALDFIQGWPAEIQVHGGAAPGFYERRIGLADRCPNKARLQ